MALNNRDNFYITASGHFIIIIFQKKQLVYGIISLQATLTAARMFWPWHFHLSADVSTWTETYLRHKRESYGGLRVCVNTYV